MIPCASHITLLSGFLLLVSSGIAFSEGLINPPVESWSARWISADRNSDCNLWTCYRKSFDLAKKPKSALARIAVDSKCWLWVNGKLAVREGGLKRGPNPTDTYFDEVDLAPYLKPGSNTIAVLVWFFGKEGFSHKSSGKSGLLFQMDAGGNAIVSDSNWRAAVHPSFENTGDPHPNFRLPESNIRFDAQKDVGGWQDPKFDDSKWPAAVEQGRPYCAPWNKLAKRPVPQWKDYGLKPYANSLDLPRISDGKTLIAKMPYNAQVTPYFKIEAPAEQVIRIQTDAYNMAGGESVRAEYVTSEGAQEFECFGWMNGHEVHYDMPAGIKIIKLGYRETGFDTEFTGTFECDDQFFNKLREKAARTLYITMRDTYMDCPDRERALWWGDAVNEIGESFYAFDRKSDSLARKCMYNLIEWQRPDGVLYAPVPEGNWKQDLPMQVLASVGRTGFWTYGLYSGDLATLRDLYPGVKRYLQVWQMQENGLVKPMRGGWEWGDWGDNIDMAVLYDVWYYIGLQGMREMAVALQHSEDLPWIDSRLKSIEESFNKTNWTGKEYRSPGYTGQTDDRANALAVVAGLAKPDQYPAITEVLRTQYHASPYMEKYVIEALCIMDQPSLAQERIKKRFAKMVDSPYTTLWEGWGIGSDGFGGGTYNHAWTGGPLTIMSQYFAGIAPTSVGFATYQVRPQMGNLKKIKAAVQSPKGEINLTISRSKGAFTLKLISPKGTTARVYVPASQSIEVNGHAVVKDGNVGGKIQGISHVMDDAHYAIFDVKPGVWEFIAK